MPVPGIELVDKQPLFGAGDKQKFIGKEYDHRFTLGIGEGWTDPINVETPVRWDANDVTPSHYLRPSTLPSMMFDPWRVARVRHISSPPPGPTSLIPIVKQDDIYGERTEWTDLLTGGSLTIPPNTRRRVLVDLDNYLCAYTHLVTSGGAGSTVRVHWNEALFEDFERKGGKNGSWIKGNRDDIEGKFFTSMWWKRDGVGDTFLPGGREREEFMALWFSCGRYVEIYVETMEEGLTIESLTLFETRYPLSPIEPPFKCDDERWNRLSEICLRTLQMCSHETYYDCPYFEQLQYVGDTRIQALLTMVISQDDRLVRKALQILDWSRISNTGFTQSRYPSRSRQMIPTFSLWWVCMVYDYALWRGDKDFLRSLLPGCRNVLDAWAQHQEMDPKSPDYGLIRSPEGWNYVDWVAQWKGGTPPGGERGGISSAINLQYILAFEAYSELSKYVLDDVPSRKSAEAVRQGILRRLVTPDGLIADGITPTGELAEAKSQHSSMLAALTLDSESLAETGKRSFELVLPRTDLYESTVYFRHYWYETLAKRGLGATILNDLEPRWTSQMDDGLKTCIESPEPTRSDCHAWAAHPLYQFLTTTLGVRPTAFGGTKFDLNPNLGGLKEAQGSVFTNKGPIQLKLKRSNGSGLSLEWNVPDGIELKLPDGSFATGAACRTIQLNP